MQFRRMGFGTKGAPPLLVALWGCSGATAGGGTPADAGGSSSVGDTTNAGSATGGAVSPSGCPAPYAECEGHCYRLLEDPRHCGACGVECRIDQTCNTKCLCRDMNRVECGGHCANLQTDPANCGACGNACPDPMSCVNGSCYVEDAGN